MPQTMCMCIPVIIFACALLLVAAVHGAGAAAGGGAGDGADRTPTCSGRRKHCGRQSTRAWTRAMPSPAPATTYGPRWSPSPASWTCPVGRRERSPASWKTLIRWASAPTSCSVSLLQLRPCSAPHSLSRRHLRTRQHHGLSPLLEQGRNTGSMARQPSGW